MTDLVEESGRLLVAAFRSYYSTPPCVVVFACVRAGRGGGRLLDLPGGGPWGNLKFAGAPGCLGDASTGQTGV